MKRILLAAIWLALLAAACVHAASWDKPISPDAGTKLLRWG